jgi:hypothetical protein
VRAQEASLPRAYAQIAKLSEEIRRENVKRVLKVKSEQSSSGIKVIIDSIFSNNFRYFYKFFSIIDLLSFVVLTVL